MPTPVSTRPASMAGRPVAPALSSGPASRGTVSSRKARRLPRESARPLPAREPTAAPASRLLTTCARVNIGGEAADSVGMGVEEEGWNVQAHVGGMGEWAGCAGVL